MPPTEKKATDKDQYMTTEGSGAFSSSVVFPPPLWASSSL